MAVEYPHRRIWTALVPDADPNISPPLETDVVRLKDRPNFGGQNINTTSHSLYAAFETAGGVEVPGAVVSIVAWERDAATSTWVRINDTPVPCPHRSKVNGVGVQMADLYFQAVAFASLGAAATLTLRVTEQGTETDAGYGADVQLGTVTANQGAPGALPWPVTEALPATGTNTSVAQSSAVAVVILAANTARRGATVYNDSSQRVYLLLSDAGTVSATSFTVRVDSQGYYEVPFGYKGRIHGIWASGAAGAARVTEFTL